MDETSLPLAPPQGEYRCPGESYSIDRSIHLGRLAAFYPACRQCAHRHEARLLSPKESRLWAEAARHPTRLGRWDGESFAASSPNDLGPPVLRRLVQALAQMLWRDGGRRRRPPAVAVAADGHWTTADSLAAACESLALAGCRAIEIGAATSASLVVASRSAGADAALWIGSARGSQLASHVRFWGAGGRPWSAPGELAALAQNDASFANNRPRRSGGALARASARDAYLAPMSALFHALRPLRFVLDTSSTPFWSYWREVSSQSACQALVPRQATAARPSGAADARAVERSLALVGDRVVAESAHFGVWIDGDGEACRLVDERGTAVESERLSRLLADFVCRERAGARVVIDAQASGELAGALVGHGARVAIAAGTRQAMFDCMESRGGAFGIGAGGRFWYGGEPPLCDGLMTVALLLTILSQSDRPLSAVLDAACAAL
jgi:phosphomannomutase